MLAVVCDFRVDFSRTDKCHTMIYYSSFILTLLEPRIWIFQTYSLLTRVIMAFVAPGWIMYDLTDLCTKNPEITVISSGMNLSDRRPLCV